MTELRRGVDIPEWLFDDLQDARLMFNVGDEWHINVRLTDRPSGSDNNAGCCATDYAYLNADLEFARDLERYSPAKRRRIVIHETLHIATAEIVAIVDEMSEGLGKHERRQWKRRHREAIERFIQRTSRGMTQHFAPAEEQQEEPTEPQE